MDYHLTWYKCCPHWDDVQWPWRGSIPQRSSSHEKFKGQSSHPRLSAISYVCINGLPSYLVHILSSMSAVQWHWPGTLTQRSRSHNTFNGPSTRPRVRAITYVCIDVLPSNKYFIKTMYSDLDPDPYFKGQGHVRQCKMLQIKDSFSFFF